MDVYYIIPTNFVCLSKLKVGEIIRFMFFFFLIIQGPLWEGNWEEMSRNAQNTQRVIAVTQERSADVLPWLLHWVFKAGSELDGFKYIVAVESIAFS